MNCAIVNSKQSRIAFCKDNATSKKCQAKIDKKKGKFNIKIIAERLKESRNAKAKTQNDLAALLNISRAAFGEYERGNNLPPIDKLIVIAQELEVSLDWLAGLEPQPQPNIQAIRDAALQIATSAENIMKAVENE